jgi:hypothetical protein
MATRIGIELSPAACRIVEIDGALPWRRSRDETRVRSFAVLPPSGPETRAKLESLRWHHAAVSVWRIERAPSGDGDRGLMSRCARSDGVASAVGLQTTGV